MEKKRILVVDDEPSVVQVVVEFLERTGYYEVRAATNPDEGLAVARDFRPDLLVLDIVMPGMDGGELLAAIRAESGMGETRAVFLTGLVTEEEVGPGGSPIGDPVIAKPVRADAFRRVVAEQLRDAG